MPVSTSTPVSVINSVCSNCAESDPSSVAAVHRSGQVTCLAEPIQIMGSMVKVWPGCMTALRSLLR